MKKKINNSLVCPYCKDSNLFKLYENVYSKNLIKDYHLESVCAKCRSGFVLILKKGLMKMVIKK